MKSGLEHVVHADARSFAVREGWVGAGWGLTDQDGVPDGSTDFGGYLQIASELFDNRDSLVRAGTTIAEEMEIGDYAFMYDSATGDYWCGVVTGPFVYRHGDDFDRYDLHLLRPCRWTRLGTADAVPGAIRRAFAGQFGTVTKLVTGLSAIVEAAELALGFRKVSERQHFFDVASPEDLEDVASLYLQKQGWSVYPSTSKHSMATYEFIMISRDGRRAGIQVKSGNFSYLKPEVSDDLDVFFVLMANEKARVDANSNKIVILPHQEIENFAIENWHMLPKRLQMRWPKPLSPQ